MPVEVAEGVEVQTHAAAGTALKEYLRKSRSKRIQQLVPLAVIMGKLRTGGIIAQLEVEIHLHPGQLVGFHQPRHLREDILVRRRTGQIGIVTSVASGQKPIRVRFHRRNRGKITLRLHPQSESQTFRAHLIGKFGHPSFESGVGLFSPVANLLRPVPVSRTIPAGIHGEDLAADFFGGVKLIA